MCTFSHGMVIGDALVDLNLSLAQMVKYWFVAAGLVSLQNEFQEITKRK